MCCMLCCFALKTEQEAEENLSTDWHQQTCQLTGIKELSSRRTNCQRGTLAARGEGVGEGEEVADERVGEAGLAGGDGLGQTGGVPALREALQLPVAGGPLPSLGPLHQTGTGAAVAALGSPPPAMPPAARSPGRRAPPAGTRWSRGGGLGRRSRRPPPYD